MLKFFNFFLYEVAVAFAATVVTKHNNEQIALSSNFTDFQRCLLYRGFGLEKLVRRDKSKDYTDLNYQWQQKRGLIKPLAYAVVESDTDVAAVVHCGKSQGIRLVAKSGGHSIEKYSFGDKNSVIVDLHKLTQVAVNHLKMTAEIGAGNLIAPLQWTLWNQAVFLPTGFCPTVGISGVTLGGGVGNFAQTYGLTADQVLEMTVVTANGSIVKASTEVNDDLFWALRGAGATSFGIVTKFRFRVFSAPLNVFVGFLNYPLQDFPAVFMSWQDYSVNPSDKLTVELDILDNQIAIRFVDPSGHGSTFEEIKGQFPTTRNVTRQIFTFPEFLLYEAKELSLSVDPMVNLSKPSDLAKINRRSTESAFVKRKNFFVKSKISTPEILELETLLLNRPVSIILWFEGYRAKVNDLLRNDTAFVHRGETLYCVIASYRAVDPSEEQIFTATKWLQEFFDISKKIFGHDESYQNYIDPDAPDFLQRYYGSNLEKLIEVKRKYDPDNYFNNPQSLPVY